MSAFPLLNRVRMFYLDEWAWALLVYVCAWMGLISMLTYLFMLIAQFVATMIPNDLKKKYNAEWAVVTGASSGIGKALSEKLAAQGINVVLVALDDDLLRKTTAELEGRFPTRRFRACGVNLGDASESYMTAIKASTDDLQIKLLFNNAGFILPGMFPDTDYSRVRANLECNAVSIIPITHHFVGKMISMKHKGLVTFTSSSGGYLPSPTSTLYSSTKAFITNFGGAIAGDIKDAGIDVLVMHPSPVATNFYTGTSDQMGTLKTAMKAAVGPAVIADQIFAGAGRITMWDQGAVSIGMRILLKLLDPAFVVEIISRFGYLSGDHANMVKKSVLRGAK